ncbi:MAG: CHY zinc finger protein, partial [Bryobacteraceae bacterium]
AQTRCAHYHSPLDIIAIKMACCGIYYACKDCHDAVAGHAAKVWPRVEWDSRAILCGACGGELTIREYMASGYACPRCGAAFNPGCRKHYQFYFETEEGD